MDNNTMYVILAVVILLALAAFFMRNTLREVSVTVGSWFSGSAKGGKGAVIQRNTVEGDENKASVEGPGSTMTDNKTKGNKNEFIVKS